MHYRYEYQYFFLLGIALGAFICACLVVFLCACVIAVNKPHRYKSSIYLGKVKKSIQEEKITSLSATAMKIALTFFFTQYFFLSVSFFLSFLFVVANIFLPSNLKRHELGTDGLSAGVGCMLTFETESAVFICLMLIQCGFHFC